MEFYNYKTPKAKKEHICEYCNEKIHIGEKHSHAYGKYEGYFFSRRLHLVCNNMLNTCLTDLGVCEFDYEMLDDWLRERYCLKCEEKDNCEANTRRCPHILKNFQEREEQ